MYPLEVYPVSEGMKRIYGYLAKTKHNRESGSSHQRHNRQHYDGKVTSLGYLLGMPVKLSNGIADRKQQSNLHTQVTY